MVVTRQNKYPYYMTKRRPHSDGIVVVGGSAGGIPAVCTILAGLPANFNLPILIVNHVGPSQSQLPNVLDRCGPLTAVHPRRGQRICAGCVYVAPSNRHLLVQADRLELSSGPRENHFRPAIDPLLRTVARWCRARSI